jgi:outer membrane PBP1 activator LpoA protein
MQRAPAFLVLLLSLLYFGAGTLATRAAVAQEQAGVQGPYIAVLLPLQSPTLGRLADAVRRGVLEAHRVHAGSGLPVVILASGEDPYEITQAYERAVQHGARFIIGPLTRSAVSVVASSNLAGVPTLALNAPEADVPSPYELYLFGMQVESEARQLARLAAQQGRRRALIVASDSPLSKRLAEAFRAQWLERGNQVEDEFQYTTDVASLSKLRDMLTIGTADMVFLALEAKHAKLIRSYLGLSMPIYATSLVHTSDAPLANYELNGVYFVDMPWLLTPDHPAVMSYERPDPAQANIEYQRFYAIGIDAYRIAQSLLKPDSEFQPLDGVTGYITLDRDRRLTREAVPAQFVQGETRVLSDPSTQ